MPWMYWVITQRPPVPWLLRALIIMSTAPNQSASLTVPLAWSERWRCAAGTWANPAQQAGMICVRCEKLSVARGEHGKSSLLNENPNAPALTFGVEGVRCIDGGAARRRSAIYQLKQIHLLTLYRKYCDAWCITTRKKASIPPTKSKAL